MQNLNKILLNPAVAEATGTPAIAEAPAQSDPKPGDKLTFVNSGDGKEYEYIYNHEGEPVDASLPNKMLLVRALTGGNKGLNFHVVQFKNKEVLEVKAAPAVLDEQGNVVKEAVKAVAFIAAEDVALAAIQEMINDYSAVKVVDAVNNELDSGTRRKVRSTKIASFENSDSQKAWVKRQIETDNVLFNRDEALAYIPGERDMTSNQIMAKIRDARKNGMTKEVALECKRLLDELQATLEREALRSGVGLE